ncbi:hypothetical protein QFC24_004035 [Naganishia onofrii]|uniref:Uncharacterized protein n=1 Tax=Naganishia onofrii TaxID=1851511 RepID=A0ACC2XIX6_9TREE|nr:hypothetical protein QFC24_004035 [Naganishia onofrii]
METSVIAHAPGFTLFENAYWRNHTWYFVSARPWAFPELPMVMTNAPDYGETSSAMFHDGLAKVVLPSETEDMGLNIDEVEVVEGTTFFFNDKIYLKHLSVIEYTQVYHLVGEMFLGSWRVYTSVLVNPFVKSPQQISQANAKSIFDRLPPIERFIFGQAPPEEMYDRGRMNKYFLDRVFPNVPLEFKESWQARANTLKLFRFDMVVIADRWSGHMMRTSKPMDYAFRLPVPPNWVSDLKERMLAKYRGPVSLQDPSHANSKPVVTYLSRQEAFHRTLNPETHKELIVGLKALEEEGLAEVQIERFTDTDPKDEQAAKLSRTTIFVGLHGNGLTNLIWMTPDAYGRSAIYEIQQPGMFTEDYAILSEALGIEHWIIGGRDEELE